MPGGWSALCACSLGEPSQGKQSCDVWSISLEIMGADVSAAPWSCDAEGGGVGRTWVGWSGKVSGCPGAPRTSLYKPRSSTSWECFPRLRSTCIPLTMLGSEIQFIGSIRLLHKWVHCFWSLRESLLLFLPLPGSHRP